LFSATIIESVAISDWSVDEAPFSNSACVQTVAPSSRRATTTLIGSSLSAIATWRSPMSVGVVPEPGCVWPGFVAPVLS
jgi:hypothetical protein